MEVAMSVPKLVPVLLLVGSNLFMTFAWYAHLKTHRSSPLWIVILSSWALAFFEYCFQVPANRLGMDAGYDLAELKTIQEVVSLSVFVVFMVIFWGAPLRWNHLVGFGLIALGAGLVFEPLAS